MTKPLDHLHQQHQNIHRLVDLLEREIGVVDDGGMPNVSMLQDIMQWGEHAEVLEPSELRAEIAGKLRSCLDKYA